MERIWWRRRDFALRLNSVRRSVWRTRFNAEYVFAICGLSRIPQASAFRQPRPRRVNTSLPLLSHCKKQYVMLHTEARTSYERKTSGLSPNQDLFSGRTRSVVRYLLAAAFPVLGFGQVSLYPGNNIQQSVDQHPAGTTFVLNAGVYRLQSV